MKIGVKMNKVTLDFIQKYTTHEMIQGKSVLEIGSLNVNGSIRPYIESLSPRCYIGIDFIPGNNVDIVMDILNPAFQVTFDVVICLYAMEHIRKWYTATQNMVDLLKLNGLLIFAVPNKKFHYHGYPHDWWRWSLIDLQFIFSMFNQLVVREHPIENTIVFMARKTVTTIKVNRVNLNSIFVHINTYKILARKLLRIIYLNLKRRLTKWTQ
jgi:SAM-dependent methyltransferase